MKNNSTNSSSFPNPSSLFISTPSPQRIPVSSSQQKRNQFSNKIRQQQRDKIKHIKRQQQLQFLKSMGIAIYKQENQNYQYQNDNNEQLFQYIEQQGDNMYVQYMMNCELNNQEDNELDSKDNNEFDLPKQYVQKSYQQIRQYKQKDLNQDQTNLWKTIQKQIIQYYKQSKYLCNKEIKWIQQTLQTINHILSMEMFYSPIEWFNFRCINPDDYDLILQFIFKVYCQHLKEKIEFSQQTKQSISTLVLLIICYELKMQSYNQQLNKQNKQKTLSWQNKILFQQILEIPWLWEHWSMIQQSSLIELKIYAIDRILTIVSQETKSIKQQESRQHQQKTYHQNIKDNSNINDKLIDIRMLLDICEQIILRVLLKANQFSNYKILSKINNNFTNSLRILQTITIYVYETVGNLNGLLSLVIANSTAMDNNANNNYHRKEQNNKLQNRLIDDHQENTYVKSNQQLSLLLIKLIRLLHTTDRLFYLINQHHQQSNKNLFSQKSHLQTLFSDKKLSNYLLQVLKQNQLPKNHFIHKSSRFFNTKSNQFMKESNQFMKESKQYDCSRQLQDFEKEFVTLKVITLSEILTLSCQNLNNEIITQNQRFSKKPSAYQIKCLSLTMNKILYMFEQTQFSNKIVEQCQKINSIDQMVLILKGIKQGQNGITAYLILMCKQLLNIFSRMVIVICSQQQQSRQIKIQKHKKRYQGVLVQNLMLVIQTLNSIAQIQQQNIWRYSCLLYQTVSRTQCLQQSKQEIFQPIIQQCQKFLDYLNNKFTKINKKSKKVVNIKTQVGIFLQNIVYYYFPLQTHFAEFAIEKTNQESLNDVMKLAISYDELIGSGGCEQASGKYAINIVNDTWIQRLEQMCSQVYLDKQAQKLLFIVQSLLQQTCISTQIKAIKTVYILMLLTNSRSAFNYFQSFIKSSTQIYKKIQYMAQQAEHSSIRQTAEQFLQHIDGGYQQDSDNNEQDQHNKQYKQNKQIEI